MSRRRKKLVANLERAHRQWVEETQPRRVDSAEFYEAAEDGILPDGRTFEDLGGEPTTDIHGDE